MTAPITPDERAAMRRLALTTPQTPGEHAYVEHVPRLLDALDTAEAETANAREACRTLGRIVEQQCIDIAKITRSEHLVTEDGDADWGAIWDRGHELADRAEKAEAEVARLREDAEALRGWITEHEETIIETSDALDEARAEVARLREEAARPAPVWDEDTVTEAVARAMFPHYFTDDRQPLRVFTETRSDAELRDAEREAARHRARQALAVVREHVPVRPDREAVADVLMSDWHGEYTCECQTDRCPSLPCPTSTPSYVTAADAVLDLWPGESRATVQAEALRDAAERLGPWTLASEVRQQLLDDADRLRPKGA